VSGRVTFDSAAPAGTINFGLGQPSADLLPVDLMRRASEAYFREALPETLNYGPSPGDEAFLESLAAFLSRGYGAPVDPGSLFVTGGSSQGLDLISTVFAQAGDTIFVEEPSYFLAFQIFRDHGLTIVGIPVDEEGLDLEVLQRELRRHQPKLVYTIPVFHNPGGHSMSARRRLELIRLSEEHGFLIVADEVYQLLSYFGRPDAPFASMIDSGNVLALGSFSKILAPGLRLGWLQASPALRQRAEESGFISSGGSMNRFTTHVVRQAIDLGLLEEHLGRLRQAYRSRVEAMDIALTKHFSDIARWVRPDGGYFFWVRFDSSVDTTPLKEEAARIEAGFQPGALFSSRGELQNFLRLSFARHDEVDIATGIGRLRPLFDGVAPVEDE
jgi:DNA-binding transcriptional MocR family regulator